MARLIIEILIVMVVSSIAFVLGAIFGSSTRRSDEEEAKIEELMSQSGEIMDKEKKIKLERQIA
jgi:type II secretory pathway pseudopilin PulG